VVIPPHIRGVAAESVVVPADSDRGVIELRFDAEIGPFNMPITARALLDGGGRQVVAETKVELVAAAPQ
jgi:hypothetical protein